jgi:hypothetical protein
VDTAGSAGTSTPEQVATTLATIRETATRYERPAALGELEITITPPAVPDLDTARRDAEAGVHRLVLQPPDMDGRAMNELISTVGDTLIGNI